MPAYTPNSRNASSLQHPVGASGPSFTRASSKLKLFRRLTLIAVAVIVLLFSGCTTKPEADLILKNGTIVTLDDEQPRAEALAAAGDTILAVGGDDQITEYAGSGTRVVDLGGRLAVPGFIEGHGHFMQMGAAQMKLDLLGTDSWEQIVAMVDSAADQTKPGEWVVGRGWHQDKWKESPEYVVRGFPTNKRLNEVAPNTPVYLTHASGHAAIVNQEALRAAGIKRSTPDPAGGDIIRDELGRATGVLVENATALARKALEESRGDRSAEERRALKRKMIRLASQQALSHGVTSFHDQGASLEIIRLYRKMAEQGELGIRLYAMISQSEVTEENRKTLAEIRTIGAADHHLTVRAIGEVTADGALGSRSAWMLKPYNDAPGNTGINVTPIERIRKIAEIGLALDYQIAIHAIGDRANRETLDLFASIFKEHQVDGESLRWRIEHAQHLHPRDIPRFAELGVIASMQGMHACSDAPYNYERLGRKRVKQGAYVWKTLWESGAVVANGTDVPVEKIDPLANFHCTVTRQVPGTDTTFTPEEALTRRQALKSYTLNNAYAAFQEDIKGSLEPGKLADIAVLSKNIMKGPASRIKKAEVEMTILGGNVVYEGR